MKFLLSVGAIVIALAPVRTSLAQLEEIRMVPNTPDYTDAIGQGGNALQFQNGDIAIVYKIQTDYTIEDYGPDRLYIITSSDGGDTWSDPEEIDNSDSHQGICCISTAVSSTNRAAVVYFNADDGWKMLYSDDDGSSWTTAPNFPNLGNIGNIAEGMDGSFMVAFLTSGANRDILSVRTSEDGLAWGSSQTAVSSDGVYLCDGNIAEPTDGHLIVVYQECLSGSDEVPIMQVSSTDGGQTWGEPSVALSGLGSGPQSDVAVDEDGTLWMLHTSAEDLYFTTSTDGGATWAESTQWTDNTGIGNNPGDFDQDFVPKLAIVDGKPFGTFIARRGNDWWHIYYGIPGESSDPLLVTSVEQVSAEIPSSIELGQNYPNPFNPSTTISFSLSETGQTSLVVYDLMGREQARLVDATLNAGTYEITLQGSALAGGSYVYRLNSGNASIQRMMTLLK